MDNPAVNDEIVSASLRGSERERHDHICMHLEGCHAGNRPQWQDLILTYFSIQHLRVFYSGGNWPDQGTNVTIWKRPKTRLKMKDHNRRDNGSPLIQSTRRPLSAKMWVRAESIDNPRAMFSQWQPIQLDLAIMMGHHELPLRQMDFLTSLNPTLKSFWTFYFSWFWRQFDLSSILADDRNSDWLWDF